MRTCTCSVVPAILISPPKPPTNWHLSPLDVFSSDTPLTTKVTGVFDLTTNNIIVSRHIIFDEADFSFSTSPHLTNDLDIFLHDDSPGAASMPAPQPVPYIPLGFPPLATASGLTTPGTEADGQIVSPGGQTALGTKAGGQTVSPSGTHDFDRPAPAPPVRHPRLRLHPMQRPQPHPCHARPQHQRLWLHHPWLRSPTRSTTRITLGL
jgi:hypothetical protein